MLKNSPIRWLTILSMLIVVPLGLLTIKYQGYAPGWINDSAGDILYEIFWCLFVFLFIPTRKAVSKIALGVFAVTCAIEFLQLWHPPFFEWRSYFLGRLLLGLAFDWWDFPKYVVGSIIGWLWLRLLARFDDPEPKVRQ